MIPPKYTLFPSAVLRMSKVPIHLRWTYLVLYALAWANQYQYVNENLDQLSAIFTDLEGRQIEPRGIRQRLADLAEYGLVERQQTGSRQYRTYLLIRHDQLSVGDAPNVTHSVVGDALERHPINNNVAVVDTDLSHQEKQQQHQYSTKLGDAERNEELLAAMGVNNPARKRLAREPWVTPEYLEGWMKYIADEARKGNRLGPGYVVVQVGNAEEPAELEEAQDRYRYVKGKYKDYVKW